MEIFSRQNEVRYCFLNLNYIQLFLLLLIYFCLIQRYIVNDFRQVTITGEDLVNEEEYKYFIRPYVPFWSIQKLSFSNINEYSTIPTKRQSGSRDIIYHLVKTWINKEPNDRAWFDKQEIYTTLKEALAAKLRSETVVVKDYRKHFPPFFIYLPNSFKFIPFLSQQSLSWGSRTSIVTFIQFQIAG